MTVTLEEVQKLAAQLSPFEQVRLIAYLTQHIVPVLSAALDPVATQTSASWKRLEAFWQEIEALGPAAPSLTEQILADRRSRQERLNESKQPRRSAGLL